MHGWLWLERTFEVINLITEDHIAPNHSETGAFEERADMKSPLGSKGLWTAEALLVQLTDLHNKCLLSACCIPGIAQLAGDIAVNKGTEAWPLTGYISEGHKHWMSHFPVCRFSRGLGGKTPWRKRDLSPSHCPVAVHLIFIHFLVLYKHLLSTHGGQTIGWRTGSVVR